MEKHRVYTAEPYRPGAMHYSARPPANSMLIQQYQFPDEYDRDLDKLHGAHSDRLFEWDSNHAGACYDQHGVQRMEKWARSTRPDKVLAFLRDILKADRAITWTGWRVLGDVNRATGYEVYHYELFAKHPESSTPVYSGMDAPNVQGYLERKKVWISGRNGARQSASQLPLFEGDWP